MARYIDAEQFLKSTISKFNCIPLVGVTSYINGEECFDGEHFDTLINEQTTADVEEVKHGKWVHTDKARHWTGKDECSECTYHSYDRDDLSHLNYCPNCGAKMDGRRDT